MIMALAMAICFINVQHVNADGPVASITKGGKTYYIKIRTYKTVKGTKCFSKWSDVKTAKTR